MPEPMMLPGGQGKEEGEALGITQNGKHRRTSTYADKYKVCMALGVVMKEINMLFYVFMF
jgi:hypothetical protein